MNINTNYGISYSHLLDQTTKAINKSLERLSTGKRINSAADDAAGFAVSVNLDAKIRGLSQANLNANQAMGLIQTADSALSVQLDILQKIRELAVEGASETLTASDRSTINTQLVSLREEFSRITNNTEFNGTKLLDGSFGTQTYQIGSDYGDEYDVSIGSLQASSVFEKTVGQGSFFSATTVDYGTDEDAVQLADMNGDGILDLVIANDTDNTISIAAGNGDGTFGARTTQDIESNPGYLNIADVNGDGIQDVIVFDANATESIAVLIGNGDGTLQARTTYAVTLTGSSSESVTGDFDGDGDIDIVVGDSTSAQISLLINNGDGTFQSEVTQATTAGVIPGRLSVADFNNDGIDDIFAISAASGTGQVLLGDSSGTFTLGSTAAYSVAISSVNSATGDFNNDGKQDLIINTNSGNVIKFLAGNGDGTFATATNFTAAGNHNGIKVGDVNGDGNLDIVGVNTAGANSSAYYISLGDGNGGFTQKSTGSATFNTTQSSSAFDLGDINGDGILDIVGADATNDYIQLLLQKTSVSSAVSDINVDSADKANALLDIVDTAIDNLNSERTNLAISLNTLQSAYDYNSLLNESYTQAKSNIEDVDISEETSNLVVQQILQQAQIAAFGQANVNAQVVLQLLQN